jgi:hypothetical protein
MYFNVFDEHSVELLNSIFSSFSSFKVHITITFGFSSFIIGNFTGENISKDRESIVQSLVVNGWGEIADKNVAQTSFTETRISLRPHDAARLSTNVSEVHGIQSSFSILYIVKVHIRISQRTTGDSITTNTNGSNWTNTIEEVEENALLKVRNFRNVSFTGSYFSDIRV